MLSELPDASGVVLEGAPATIVIFAVQTETERPMKPADASRWQKLLAANGYDATGSLQKVRQQNIEITRAGPTTRITREGWQCRRNDGTGSASVYEDGLILECSEYEGFDIFRGQIVSVVTSLAQLFEPHVQTRLTLRYQNALSNPDAKKASYWQDKVSPSFLFIGADDRLTPDLEQSLSMATFRDKDDTLQVRCALQPDAVHKGAVAFVFDLEASNTSLCDFTIEECVATTGALNGICRKMFDTVLTPAYRESLRSVAAE